MIESEYWAAQLGWGVVMCLALAQILGLERAAAAAVVVVVVAAALASAATATATAF